MRVHSSAVFGLVVLAGLSTSSFADIRISMTRFASIPRVQITRGRTGACSGNRTVVYDGPVKRGYELKIAGAGDKGDDICWRRSEDVANPKSDLDLWNRCWHSGECPIH